MHSPRQLKRLRRNNAGAQSDSSEDEIEQVQLMDTNSEQDSEEVSGGETQQDAVKHNVHSKTKCWLFFTVPQKGVSKSTCNICKKSYTCVDRKMKLTTSGLKTHLLREHSSNASVRAAYLLDEAEKVVNSTPRQTITKYAKAASKQEGHMDQYVRGSFQDVQLNRALQHWLSCANLPHNLVDGGAFINWCYNMNPRYRVPSRPYIQRNFLQPGYTAATKMLSVYLMYLDTAVWISSDAWKSRYGKFSLISLTVHFLDDDWNYSCLQPLLNLTLRKVVLMLLTS